MTEGDVISTPPEPSGEVPAVYSQEHTGADCPLPDLPAYADLPSIDELPNPFQMSDGSLITAKSEWRCRRAEINARIQKYELGIKPPPPPSQIEATMSGNKLTVVVTDGGGSITLTSTINVPSGAGPFPAIIGVGNGTGSLPANVFTSRNIATVTFSETQLTPQQPGRGEGAFYKLYPDAKVGSYAAWAWGVSRIIDGLEQTAAQNKIDVSHLGVTGCSYAGKLALYAGAFDERIALTIPQESGGGGEAAWRVSQVLPGKVESLSNAQGTSWYHQDLKQFNATPEKLPFDQHELAAMVAPRALLAIGNSGIEYLATEAGYVSLRAASEVWKALGVPERMGVSHSGNHGHCAFPDGQLPELTAFVERFLLGKSDVETDVAVSPYDTDLARWVPWTTPVLQ